MKLLLSLVAALCATAQTNGLPEYGVLLEGTVDAPVIHNNSRWQILAFALQYDNAGSSFTNFLDQLRSPRSPTMGIAPGGTLGIRSGYLERTTPVGGGRFPVPTQTRDARGLPVQHTSVALDAVLFEDGHLVGPDKGGLFQRITEQIKAEQEVAAILLDATDRNAAWATIQSIASSPPLPRDWREIFADQLMQVRHVQGDAAAVKLAESSRNYPVIVKGE